MSFKFISDPTTKQEANDVPKVGVRDEFRNCLHESISVDELMGESERPIVGMKSGNSDGPKGPYYKDALNKERRTD